jgi:hypothetical protein
MSETMRNVILPSIEDPHVKLTLIRLIGLAEYAPSRVADPSERRINALVSCIDRLAASHAEIKQQLPAQWPSRDEGVVLDLCSKLLAGAVGDKSATAQAIRAEIKALLLAQLDEDIVDTDPLISFFGGQLNGN